MPQNQEIISLDDLIKVTPGRPGEIECSGFCGSDTAFATARLYKAHPMPMVVITAAPKDSQRFIEDLHFFSEEISAPIIYFPPYNILPFKFLAYHNETAARRVAALYQIVNSTRPPIIITTVGALLQKVFPKKVLGDYAELIAVGEELDRDALVEKLVSGSYAPAMIVEEPGDFCVRGGILDIFSPLYPEPIRIELDGDIVDSLRFFSPSSQRTTRKINEAIVLPAREVILAKGSLSKVLGRIRSLGATNNVPVTQTRFLIERLKKEGTFAGIESLIPLIYDQLDTLFEYVSDATIFIRLDPAKLQQAAENIEEQVGQSFLSACQDNKICAEPKKFFLTWEAVRKFLTDKKSLVYRQIPVLKQAGKNLARKRYHVAIKDNSGIRLDLKKQGRKENLLAPFVKWITEKLQLGFSTLLVCQTSSQLDRLKSLLLPYGIQLQVGDHFFKTPMSKGHVYGCLGNLSSGFIWQDELLAIVTESEIFDAKRPRKIKSKPIDRTQLLGLEDLKMEDLIVHNEHGIGRYEGLAKLKIERATNDFLLIYYRDDDKLYVPVDRMNVVQKYMGVDGITPVLDKMGGKSWDKIRRRVKKTAEKIAGELLKLYAARRVEKGYAFAEFDRDYKDFEAGFPFEETVDQSKAVNDTLDDMQKPAPMDRLICGDVGYGKTEVALRASFLAVNNNKQVALLVPTTVLAEQHFATFSSRFKHFAVNMACLNRFRSAKTQRQIINDLKTGKIDVVIGTHRLLQKDVALKDLGLLIIDEEQRFGVKHKEKLKNLRKTVDVLSLTATPIPRTLHLSLMGIRDISVISTPPEQRHPIITYISEIDDALIAEAIRKELHRKGQIFFVHNNIFSIQAQADHLQRLVPEVRLDIAHGRMEDEDLESVMLSFLNQEFDMLVCTTIIESGLDIALANTIFINRADRFGLAQIYQLRGRVGRAEEQAYAYLFIPNESYLTKYARKRLKVLMEHSDLGSGFQIAMNDLQIRGGGTILGASQSGHIAAVGYDMYLKLMESAVSEIKGEPVIEKLEPEINIPLSAFFPETYITDIDQRLSAYRRLAKMTALNELSDFKTELSDRFGHLPHEAANLLLKIMLKVLSINAGVKRLDLSGEQLLLYFSEAHQKDPIKIIDLIEANNDRFRVTPDQALTIRLKTPIPEGYLVQAKNILKEISRHVNA